MLGVILNLGDGEPSHAVGCRIMSKSMWEAKHLWKWPLHRLN
jgi:hypothetical protein